MKTKKFSLKFLYSVFKNLILSVLFFGIMINILAFYMPLFRDEEQKPTQSVLTDFYQEDKDIADIVFIGSSAVYRFISPTHIYSEKGVVAMNYAYGAMDIAPTCAAIDEVIKYQHPKVIAIEMRNYVNNCEEYMNGKGHSDFQMAEKHSHFEKLINSMPISLNRVKAISDTTTTTMRKTFYDEIKYQFEYFTTHQNWKNLNFNEIVSYTKEKLNGESMFYFQNQKVMEDKYYNNELTSQPLEEGVAYEPPVYKGTDYKTTIAVSTYAYQEPVDYSNYEKRNEISGYWLKMLKKIMRKAKNCDAEVVFFTSPHLLTETEMAYENEMADILAENGFDFICGNKLMKQIGLDFKYDFYDDMHVNIKGMIKFTDYVSNYLIKNYEIEKAVLNKQQKQEWETACNKWIKEVKKPGIKNVERMIAQAKQKS